MKRTIILAIACVAMSIGGLVLGPPMLAKPPLPASTAQAISSTKPSTTRPSTSSSTVQQPSTRPNITMRQPNASPKRYLILLDVSGSMSWNMAGEGTLPEKIVNCVWGGPSQLTYYEGCVGPNSAWYKESERRIYLAKEMVSNLIDGMQPEDTMEIIAFTSGMGYQSNTKVVPPNGWTSDRALLKTELFAVGSYNSRPYITSGGSANAQAMIRAQDELASATHHTPDTSTYRTVVMLVADGPASVFADGKTNMATDICPNSSLAHKQAIAQCQIGYSKKYQSDRPITQMIQAANEIKARYQVDLYTIHMASGDDDFGMVDVASNPAMAYRYIGPSMLSDMMNQGQH